MSKPKLAQFFFILTSVALLVIPLTRAAHETAAFRGQREPALENVSIAPDYSLAITAAQLLDKTRQNRGMTLVDIRSPEEFERLRIPGALNVPLHAVKTKAYLKAHPFVLVGGGIEWRDAESECKRLRQEGFKPSILFGGLVAWHRQGGPLEGDRLLVATYREIPAPLFFHEKVYGNIEIFDVSPTPSTEAQKLIPATVHMPTIAGLVKVAQQSDPAYRTLVLLTENGERDEKLDAALNAAGITNAFYLRGGLGGYRQFLENTTLSWKSRAERLVVSGGCGTCGAVNQEEAPHAEGKGH
ncbi:MAG: rhodanese-like domain-containing protein [Deltaproteobacteria bacterium]|nr:rhodanese-like domain-containing protein [Deltaproteobacteria bacterium]